mmetsp:Transcript_9686/g.40615  ORF Transcript_9686/g.40615 Transcript_9686/m.40615 type:complete len:404 (+) Transcript_9686:998-2209(+)
MSRMSSSKPRSTMRSASSITRYLQMSKFIRLRCKWSFNRPGVAVTMCTPLSRTMSVCSRPSIPPMHSMMRISAMPCFASSTVNPSMTSCVCLASSRLGHSTKPTGPSPPSSGIRFSSIIAAMIIGSENASDFPEPVNAMPMTSRPLRMAGKPWIWIGVGRVIPLRFSSSMMGFGNFISLNVLIGAGTSTPSTMMCHWSRNSSFCASVNARMCVGGFQPVSIDRVYLTSFESSDTDIRAFFSEICFKMAASSSASFCTGVMALAIIFKPAARLRSDVVSLAGANCRTFDSSPLPDPEGPAFGSAPSPEPPVPEPPAGPPRTDFPRRDADAVTAWSLRLRKGTYSSSSSTSHHSFPFPFSSAPFPSALGRFGGGGPMDPPAGAGTITASSSTNALFTSFTDAIAL